MSKWVRMLDELEKKALSVGYKFLKMFESSEDIRYISVEEMNKFLQRTDIMIFKEDTLYFPSQLKFTKDDIEHMYWIRIEDNKLKGCFNFFTSVECFDWIK